MIRLVKPSSVMVELCPQASLLQQLLCTWQQTDRPACAEDQFWRLEGCPSCKQVHTWDCLALHVNSALFAAAPGGHAACGAPASRAVPGAGVHAGALQCALLH